MGNKEVQLEEEQKKKEANAAKLREMFALVDESGDGTISWDEMEQLMHNPTALMYLSKLELSVNHLETIFRLLDDGDGEITLEEFIAGISKLKGQARSIDVVDLQHLGHKIIW